MNIYTNTGLVNHAKKAFALNTKYMWGGILKLIDNRYIAALRGIYGISPEKGYTEDRYKYLQSISGKGVFGCDCVGLIKSYYWSGKPNGGTGSPNNPYDKKQYAKNYPDVNAGMMYNAAKVKGDISTIPEIPGLIVYCKSHPHVGIYIGNGEVIECTLSARGDGVVKTKLKDWIWEYWFECPYIEYLKQGKKEETENAKIVTLAYNATVRSAPSAKGNKLGKLNAGMKCAIIEGTETKDSITGFIYVRLAGGKSQWIVKSAIQ